MSDVPDNVINHMVDRFLSWDLPEDFSPDAGITFDPVFNKGTDYEGSHRPIGTNLFNGMQAEAMVRHMVEGAPTDGRAWVVESGIKVERGVTFSIEELRTDDVLRFLIPNPNLPPQLLAVAQVFAGMARYCIDTLPRCPQRTMALNSLLDAKDRAVRTLVPKPEGL